MGSDERCFLVGGGARVFTMREREEREEMTHNNVGDRKIVFGEFEIRGIFDHSQTNWVKIVFS